MAKSSEDRESQEKLAETSTLMREKAGLSEPCVVGKNGRVVTIERKPSVCLIDKKKER